MSTPCANELQPAVALCAAAFAALARGANSPGSDEAKLAPAMEALKLGRLGGLCGGSMWFLCVFCFFGFCVVELVTNTSIHTMAFARQAETPRNEGRFVPDFY